MPQVWTDRDDAVAGHCTIGPVANDEELARLIEVGQYPQGELVKAAFPRNEVDLSQLRHAPDNRCGFRSGESLIRSSRLTTDELNEKSRRHYERKKRQPDGALVTRAGEIRALREGNPDVQLWYIYEDPVVAEKSVDDELAHAVLRYAGEGPKFTAARHKLLKLFKRRA